MGCRVVGSQQKRQQTWAVGRWCGRGREAATCARVSVSYKVPALLLPLYTHTHAQPPPLTTL